MYRWKNKKIITLIFSLALAISISIPSYVIYTSQPTEFDKLADEINREAKKYPSSMNLTQVLKTTEILKDKNNTYSARYTALENIVFFFSAGYAASHNPEMRAFGNSLKTFALEKFPQEYREGYFDISCADPVCGEKQDDELKEIQKKIKESGISSDKLDTILINYEQASYIPDKEEKKYGFGLVLLQLSKENNSQASAAAEELKEYLKTKYSFEYTN